ncbi:unnamed protein product, partial [Candidula unifasciata]
DLAYNRSQFPEITDADDNTCITDPDLKLVIVYFKAIFTWLRVFLRKPRSRQELLFVLKQNGSIISCQKARYLTGQVSQLDVYCPSVEVVDELIIAGEGVPYLCSVYISG